MFGGKMKVRRLLRNEKGQGMLEYVLLAGVIVILISIFRNQIQSAITQWTGQVTSKGSAVIQ
ncbi:MAG: hypothetical protein IT289_09825 [Oligoflexia bacterium]|nr:hypothetical protein [Oligoflexia bacterium]